MDSDSPSSDELDWPQFVAHSRQTLVDGKTNNRKQLLNDQLLPLASKPDLEPSQVQDIIRLLIPTVPRYIDAASRTAVLEVLQALLTREQPPIAEGEANGAAKPAGISGGMIRWLEGEVKKLEKGGPTATRFVVLTWACTIFASIPQDEPLVDAQWTSLVASLASLVSSLLDGAVSMKPSLRKAVLTISRRTVRNSYASIPRLVETLTTAKTEPSFRNASFLGLVMDVSLRLKDPKGKKDVGKTFVEESKVAVGDYFLNSVLASKTTPPAHVLTAFNDFFAATVKVDDVAQTYLPPMEKSLIRSPETGLAVLSAFFNALDAELSTSPALRLQLLPAVLAASKSTSVPTRTAAIQLFSVLYSVGDEVDLLPVHEQIAALFKGGKTASPDHRTTLYTMLASLPTSPKLSSDLVGTVLSLLPKESNEVTVSAMMRVVAPHLPASILGGNAVPAPQIAALVKAMQEPKPNIRRALHSTVGSALWALDSDKEKVNPAAIALAEGLLPGFESALKTVTANPLNSPSGPLEGYVAVAVLKGRLSKWGVKKIDDFIAANPTMQGLYTPEAKPSFLLWDKVYRKANTQQEEIWVAHALEAIIVADEEKFIKDAALRASYSHALLHLATESTSFEVRKAISEVIAVTNSRAPKLAHLVVTEGIRSWLVQAEKAKTVAKPIAEDQDTPVDHTPRLRSLLLTLSTFDDSTPAELREDLVSNLLVLAHHPKLGAADAGIWVDLLLHAKVAPDALIESRKESLLALIWSDASTSPSSSLFAEAAYRAATTLALILPAVIVPLLFTQFEDDLNPSHLTFIGSTEYGVWATPEGIPFVDPLAAAKPKAPVANKKSKEADIEQWEAELREALARKKPVAATLSKADRQLLERQLAKESEIRAQMAEALGRLRRGFALLLCLVNSKAELVKEYLATMVNTVLTVIVSRPATLVADEAFATYQTLGDICSDRLGFSKVALGVAVLRGVEAQVVPENYLAESLPALVTRVLYRLRFLSEQSPFDAGTFAYGAPLVSKILRSGGIGLEKNDNEGALEQLALALDFISFHARQCSETAFPRLTMIGDLLATLVGYPTLSRTATTALQDLGEAIKDNSSPAEIAAILDGAMTEESFVRFACVQALQPLDLTELDFSAPLWIAAHDGDERNRALAIAAWEENALDVPEDFLAELLPFLSHASAAIRQATAESIAEGVSLHPTVVAEAIQQLVVEYKEKAKELLPQYDQYGMVIEESLNAEDPWRARKAIATTFKLVAPYFSPADVAAFFDILIAGEALGDRSQSVRSEMLEAAMTVIDVHGKENLQSLIATFEEYLARPSTGAEAQDYIVESLVILFGRLARHLEPTDPRVKSVIARLVDALRTPSEVVQAAVCDCLPPLIRVIKDDVPDLVDQLLNDMFNATKYAERRGAAYGLAGVVRGRGISALKEFGVLGRLRDNAEDKKSVEARQGAIFGYEILSTVLGRLFEPYITEILPLLLACFGDTSREVREATQDAAKAIMGRLSGHAVKLILPTLLEGLDEKQWRAKKGAIELMGAMAFLAPRQLSVSLPTILPRLTEVLTDTHKQVRESANTSLTRFGEVVSNPEIKEMTSVLLDALVDPARKTPKALDALLATTFAHFIDSSSLALVIPILDRGLRERSADVKRKASAIVGNMATLTDAKDLTPYLSQLIPLLRDVLIDPVPEARSTSAKSLGALVERLGEANFPNLIDDLMLVLKSPSSGVDQQGAAQGLAEVLQACGIDRLEGLLPVILSNTSNPRTYVREGHISLLIFLPVTFGDRFSPYLGRIIQPVLNGLADESDYVREASMRAGRMIVSNHSSKAVDLLLPELEQGLFDEAWRIRHSSVQLVGELLFRISGVSGKPDEDDDGEEDAAEEVQVGTDAARKVLIDTLGKERRDRVLAALYIVRQDSTGVVRQSAIHVWKALVSNTPRTVREILPVLMQIIVRILASPGLEQRETAARTLADTSRKLGEAVLGEIVAILQKAMSSPERRQREGVCLALTEIMANTTKSSLEAHESAVIDVVRGALVDSDPTVRTAAAQAFDVAQQVIGTRSIDETIPTLLDALQQPGETADAALAALKEVMQVRAEKIFPVLIPRLIASPITAFNARALASLVRVAGPALGRRLTNIIDALQGALKTEKDEDTLEQIDEALTAVLASVEDHESGLGSLLMHMLSLAKHESPEKRVVGCNLFMRFCQATEADFSDYITDWIRQLVSLFDDRAPEVVGAAWMAVDALVKTVEKEDMEQLVVPLRRTIESTGTPGIPVDGFSRPNGLKPLLPILLQGLLAGTAEQREQAAYALGDLVERTDAAAFKPYTIQVVGPLIRVIGDRFPPPVKSAILSTLTILLTRVPQFVKPFFPQLQRTFVKSLTDSASLSVRNRGAAAIKVLMEHQARVDPVITELSNLAATEEGEIRDSVVNGLANVVWSAGKNMGEGSKSSALDLVSEAFADTNKEGYNVAIARLVSALALHDPSSLTFIIDSFLLSSDLPPTQLSSITLRELIDTVPSVLYEHDAQKTVARVLANAGSGMAPTIARPAREAKELLKERKPWCEDADVTARL
ncbi:ARM repeat-containing protein [Leucosporidium creatinivorum]|uniref:ARM repeat-containing protein n=1 Tax=Leucosporidium creatinivorum TaxID=106004 RepID=A0A1Y2G1W9_9BASI|nr:ARM repeat-containing protein [Leucosporidium creatinivorum]